MKHFLLINILLYVIIVSFSQTITSVQTGKWSTASTWDCNCVPPNGANIVIASGHTVTLDIRPRVNNLTIQSNAILDNNRNSITVNGNYVNNGKETGIGIINLDGINTTVDGSGIIDNRGRLHFRNGNKTILSSANLTKSRGRVIIDAGITVTNKGKFTSTGNIVGKAASSTWINDVNSILNVGKNLLATGTLNASATGNTVNYFRAGNQTIKIPVSSTYYNLTIEGTNDKTITANTTILGNLTINGGNLIVNPNTITLGGDFYNVSYFDTTVTIIFNGSSDQNITNPFGQLFENLTINKSAGVIILNNNVIVRNTLTMSSGDVNTQSNTLTLGRSVSVPGTLAHTSGTIIGTFERWMVSLSTSYLFPVGTSSYYRPALVTANSGTAGTVKVKFIASSPGSAGLPLYDAPDTVFNTFVEGYWDIQPANGASSTDYNLELTGNGFTSFTINPSTRVLTRPNSTSNWQINGIHVNAVGNTAKRNNISILPAQFCFGDTTPCNGPVTPPINGDDTVCINDANIMYYVQGNDTSTYTWTITGGTIASGQGNDTVYVNWGSTGMIGEVKVQEYNGCSSGAPVSLSVVIEPLQPNQIFGRANVAENTTNEPYWVDGKAGYTYSWSVTGGTITANYGDSIIVNWGAAGNGKVCVIATNSCGNAPQLCKNVNIYIVINSIATGFWNNTNVWDCNCLPRASDNVRIKSTHTITLDRNRKINNIIIEPSATLFDNGSNLTVYGDITNNGNYYRKKKYNISRD